MVISQTFRVLDYDQLIFPRVITSLEVESYPIQVVKQEFTRSDRQDCNEYDAQLYHQSLNFIKLKTQDTLIVLFDIF